MVSAVAISLPVNSEAPFDGLPYPSAVRCDGLPQGAVVQFRCRNRGNMLNLHHYYLKIITLD